MAEKKKIEEHLGVGRRKRAIASVRLRKGKGEFKVNGKTLKEYFPTAVQQNTVLAPFEKLDLMNQYDVIITTTGGGMEAQATACRLGISRALVGQDEDRRSPLKGVGFMTRDPRKKERKKYGLAGARKSFQFSKR